jgi:hypothetical protein
MRSEGVKMADLHYMEMGWSGSGWMDPLPMERPPAPTPAVPDPAPAAAGTEPTRKAARKSPKKAVRKAGKKKTAGKAAKKRSGSAKKAARRKPSKKATRRAAKKKPGRKGAKSSASQSHQEGARKALDLFGVETHVVGVTEHSAEHPLCPLALSDNRQRLGQPESTDGEGTFFSLQPVGMPVEPM